MSREKIKFNLLSNAEDSLRHAVNHITEKEQSAGDYKRAILDVYHVIELILKERIIRVHPAFIWDNIDRYPKVEVKTIGVGKAIARLAKLADIALPKDFQRTIMRCGKHRNAIQHYEVNMPVGEAKMIIGKMLAIIFLFSRKYLDHDFEDEFKKKDNWRALIDIYEFWEAQSEVVEQRLLDEKRPVCECPSCSADTFDLDFKKCALCGHNEEIVECISCNKKVFENGSELIDGEMLGTPGAEDQYICHNCLFPDFDGEEYEAFQREAEAAYEKYLNEENNQ